MGTELGVVFIGYGKITNIAVEPIEKRPLFHFMPGKKFLSAGGYGCSMSCDFCQNWKVSQTDTAKTKNITPLELIKMAQDRKADGICLTYNEPTVYAEYVLELGNLARHFKLPLVLKTNAFLNPEPWKQICEVVTAMNIDHKGPENRYIEAGIEFKSPNGVDNIETFIASRIEDAYSAGVHVEISIPIHYGDTKDSFINVREDIANISSNIPVHLLKIIPAYKNHSDPISPLQMRIIRGYFMRQLNYVYSDGFSDTCCSKCSYNRIIRRGFNVYIGVRDAGRECEECDRLDKEMSNENSGN